MTAREVAMKLLLDNNCSLDCYRDDMEHAVKDIQTLIDDGMNFEFNANEIATALVDIGNEQPIVISPRKEYCMCWSTDDCDDGIEFESFEAAKNDALDTYIIWMIEEDRNWKFVDGIPCPTKEQIDSWDYMIDNCYCHVAKWSSEDNAYSDIVWEASDEELNAIGWKYIDELIMCDEVKVGE